MQTNHHAHVHRVLTAHASPCRTIAVGADAVIGRALDHFLNRGDSGAQAMLVESSVALFRLRQALAAGDDVEAEAQRAVFARIAADWRDNTPLFLVAELFETQGHA